MSSGNWKELFDAACAGELDLVRYHIGQGTDVNHIHPEYFGSILVACILAKQEEVALYLLACGANPHHRSEWEGLNPLQAAQHMKLPALEKRLIALGAAPQSTAQASPSSNA